MLNDYSIFSHVRLNERAYVITESYGWNPAIPNSYMNLGLVIGDEKIAVIDSGIAGTAGLRGYIEEVILGGNNTKPIICLLSHGHLDHIGGCMMFDERYLHEIDIEKMDFMWETHPDRRLLDDDSDLCAFANYDREMIEYCRAHYYKPAPTAADFTPVHDGDLFDLGGVTLQATHMPGHTKGSCAYYDIQDHIAFCGDSLSMGGNSAEELFRIMGVCIERWAPDSILVDGHGEGLNRMVHIRNRYICAKEILDGVNLENDKEQEPRRGAPGFFKFTKERLGIPQPPRPATDPNKRYMVHTYLEARCGYAVDR